MALTFKSFRDLLSDASDYLITAGSSVIISDTRTGSTSNTFMRSLVAVMAEGWLSLKQLQEIFYVSTAVGQDLDTRLEDLGMKRNQGGLASGALAAITTASNVVVPIGTTLQTADGSVAVQVLQTRPLAANTYAALPVIAIAAGTAGNLPAGTVLFEVGGLLQNVTFKVASSGISPSGAAQGALTGGADRESDAAYRARFPDYLLSLSRGVMRSVRQALLAIPGVDSLVIQNATPSAGWLTLSVANSNGELPLALRQAIQQTMTDWAAAGIAYMLEPIARRNTNIAVTVLCNDKRLSPLQVQGLVTDQIISLGRSLTLGESLYRADIIVAGHEPTSIINITVEEPSTDVLANSNEILGISAIQVTVNYA